MYPVDKGYGPDILCNWEYASLFKGKAIPIYTADALAEAREEGRLEMRAELAAAQKDKRELLEQLRFIRAHLYAATVQRSPTDDQIIADHIEQAYRRANEVIKDAEKRDE